LLYNLCFIKNVGEDAMSQKKFAIAIHGGAGNMNVAAMSEENKKERLDVLSKALAAGAEILEKGGSAVDAAVASVMVMEDSPLFNAGKGAVMNDAGGIELDASVMDGKTLAAGGVTNVTKIKNPVKAAKAVMEDSPHTLLAADGAHAFARKFAKKHGLEFVDNKYFHTDERHRQLERVQEKNQITMDHDELEGDSSKGTVGAVALDRHGNLAAATSTGGRVNKAVGRVSDSSIVGAGTYASNDSCAISCTGTGDEMLRVSMAFNVHARMKYKGLDLETAIKETLKEVEAINGSGGVIGIDKGGNVVMDFDTTGMYRGSQTSDSGPSVAIG
jgi:L-asparaginase / beta-aspartyl-peptidase